MIPWLLIAALSVAPARFDFHPGAQLPLATPWRNEAGRAVPLASAFAAGRPVILIFGYYRCPQLCSVVERGTVDDLRALAPTVGDDLDVIYLSIDPTDTAEDARAQRAAAIRAYGRGDSAVGWHYLTGDGQSIAAVAAAAGFDYRYDRATRQFAHPAGMMVATPDGRISRYFPGVAFEPGEVAAALRDARKGEVGPTGLALVLECFRGGAGASRQERLIWEGLWTAVVATVLALGGGIAWMLRQEKSGSLRP